MSLIAKDPIYPIGKFEFKPSYEIGEIDLSIDQIYRLPFELNQITKTLQPSELNYRYREGGWNIRQIIHHISDSHLNALSRFKLGLTEENPTIRPYLEKKWAELPDSLELPVEVSEKMIAAIHEKLSYLLRQIKFEDFERTIVHPEKNMTIRLDQLTAMYSHHGRHHLGQIKVALELKIT
jgi:uncharacterized damage-inducible protein DinB